MTGLFVTIEGIDGAGTTTVAARLSNRFHTATMTTEPTEMWTGEVARESYEQRDVPQKTRFHLFQADRHAHVEYRVKPALDDGKLVICDRGPDSTRAYQTVTTDLPVDYIEDSLSLVEVQPDLTIWIDTDPEVAAERRGDDGDAYEEDEIQRRVYRQYSRLWREHDRIERIDGRMSLDRTVDVAETIIIEALQ